MLRCTLVLDDAVKIAYRDLMEADLRPRDGDLRVKMFSIDSRWNMSGNALGLPRRRWVSIYPRAAAAKAFDESASGPCFPPLRLCLAGILSIR